MGAPKESLHLVEKVGKHVGKRKPKYFPSRWESLGELPGKRIFVKKRTLVARGTGKTASLC